jgi:hypothetical protein
LWLKPYGVVARHPNQKAVAPGGVALLIVLSVILLPGGIVKAFAPLSQVVPAPEIVHDTGVSASFTFKV